MKSFRQPQFQIRNQTAEIFDQENNISDVF